MPGMNVRSKRIDDLLTNGEQPFGPLDEETYASLKYDIERNGGKLLIPVVLSARGRLIDGHHRLMIAAELGRKQITAEEWTTDANAVDSESEALAAIGYQLKRRQTTTADNAKAARALMRRFRWSQGMVAEKMGVSGKTVSLWLKNNPDPDFEVTERIGINGKVYKVDSDDEDAPPKAKAIRRPASAGAQVVSVSNKHLAEISNPEFGEWLALNADPADRVELASIWTAVSESAAIIAETFDSDRVAIEEPFS